MDVTYHFTVHAYGTKFQSLNFYNFYNEPGFDMRGRMVANATNFWPRDFRLKVNRTIKMLHKFRFRFVLFVCGVSFTYIMNRN